MKRKKHQKNMLNRCLVIGCVLFVIGCFFGCGVVGSDATVETDTEESTTSRTTTATTEQETATTTAETVGDCTIIIREIYDDSNIFCENEYPEDTDKSTIDKIVADWDASGYVWTGYYEFESNGHKTIDLYFEKRASAGYLDGDWYYIDCPSQVNSTYEGVHCITDTSSAQYVWLCSHDYYFDSEGIGMYDGRVMVALTTAFGNIGDYVDLLLADGSILPCVIVDHKGNSGTWGHDHDGVVNVIEILVSYDWYEYGHENKWYADVVAFR